MGVEGRKRVRFYVGVRIRFWLLIGIGEEGERFFFFFRRDFLVFDWS